ncbi:MAG: adenosylmethionine--8-amino-7-oxononanoate transaminase [Candidatus Binatia bacterium]
MKDRAAGTSGAVQPTSNYAAGGAGGLLRGSGASDERSDRLKADDRRLLWHPFTQATEWASYDPVIVESADGFFLTDTSGKRYLDGVSSLWCNVHGHGHPAILAALHAQLDRLQHSTMLGLSHEPAIVLARRLVDLTPAPLTRVFYSDSGSTAVEVALRMAFQYQLQSGNPARTRFVTLSEAYHGDTIGSVSLGFSEPFHRGYEPVTFRVSKFDPPFLCSPIAGRGRCDAASLEAAAGESLARLEALLEREGETVAAVVMEPLVQGAAGIWPQPPSFVRGVRELCDRFGCLLVCDEVATGFGRTGTMFAVEQAGISPDILCLAKGITAGYLPLAATLATEKVFDAFSGRPSQYRALFHGHTYGGNPLGCAAAIASLDVFESDKTLEGARAAAERLASLLDEHIEPLPSVGPVRRVGLMVGFDLWRDAERGVRFDTDERRGHRAVLLAREEGVIVRPLGDTMVLMPPLSLPDDLLETLVVTVARAVERATAN